VRQDWEPEDLLASWTLVDADWDLVANKTGATRLGFGLLLKFFELEARFPQDRSELPAAAVAFVAEQLGVAANELAVSAARSSTTLRRYARRSGFASRRSRIRSDGRSGGEGTCVPST
jgi:Domain of unknown function (DUF4158)